MTGPIGHRGRYLNSARWEMIRKSSPRFGPFTTILSEERGVEDVRQQWLLPSRLGYG